MEGIFSYLGRYRHYIDVANPLRCLSMYRHVRLYATVLPWKGDNEPYTYSQPKSTCLITCNKQYGGVIYYIAGGYEHPALIFWVNLLNATLWIACAPLIFSREKAPRAVMFISSISFEIYLIHHPFCMGTYSLNHYMPAWMAIISIFAIAITGGWLLSVITSVLLNIQKTIKGRNQVA